MPKAKPKKTIHRSVGFVAVRKLKAPRVVWKELEARGAAHVAHAQLAVGDRIVGLAGKGASVALVFADDAGLHTSKLVAAAWNGVALRDDGGAALAFADAAVAEVALPSGEAQVLATSQIAGKIEGVCYAGEHVVLLVGGERHTLVVAARVGASLEPLATHPLDVFAFDLGGRAGVIVVATDEKETSLVLTVRDGAFHPAGHIKQPINMVQTCGEQLLVTGMGGTFEVDLEALQSA